MPRCSLDVSFWWCRTVLLWRCCFCLETCMVPTPHLQEAELRQSDGYSGSSARHSNNIFAAGQTTVSWLSQTVFSKNPRSLRKICFWKRVNH